MKRALLVAALLALPIAAEAVDCDPSRSPSEWMDEGYRRKDAGELGGAATAFDTALACGFDRQSASLELGYVAAARGDGDEARRRYQAAAEGADAKLAAQARAELAAMEVRPSEPASRRFWVDVYADAFAWHRFTGAQQSSDMVPTLRVRGFWRPTDALDLDFYVFAQATRDLESGVVGTLPQIYADNYFLSGVGAQLRLWERSLAVFIQAGPAINLLDDNRPRTAFDARGGLSLYRELPQCTLAPRSGAAFVLEPCIDGYAEGVWLSRFDNNVIGFGRVRGGLAWLVTGPVAWHAIVEGRVAGDRNGDYYNNFVDGGAGLRWRLLAPVRIDLLATVDVGTYFGRSNVDPAPATLTYSDLRLQLVTFFEL